MVEQIKSIIDGLVVVGRSFWNFVEQHPYVSGVALVVLILA